MKKALLVILVGVLLLAGYLAFANIGDKDTSNDTDSTSEESINDEQSELEDGESLADDVLPEELDEQVDNIEEKKNPGESPKPQKVTPVITQASDEGDKIVVRAFIPNSTNGTCKALYTKGDTSFTETSTTSFAGSYYQCDGFSTSQSKFSSTGTWNVKIVFQSATQSGTSESRTINIE